LDLTHQNGNGNTPLHLAVLAKCFPMVELILGHLASSPHPNFDISNVEKQTVLQLAAEAKGQRMVEALLAAGCDPHHSSEAGGESALFIALHSSSSIQSTGFEAMLRAAVERPQTCTDMAQYPLHAIVCNNDPALLKICLASGMDPTTRRPDSMTPLHLVNDVQIAKLLLKSGANHRAIDGDGNTPLVSMIGPKCRQSV
jgi:ankyrin repeat protein